MSSDLNLPVTDDVLPTAVRSRRTLVILAGVLLLVLLGIGAYLWLGRPANTIPVMVNGSAMQQRFAKFGMPAQQEDTSKLGDLPDLADKLAARLKNNPDDAKGWAILARSYAVLGKPSEALKAYEKAVALAPTDTALLADYADALTKAAKNGVAGVAVQTSMANPLVTTPASAKTVSGSVTLSSALSQNAQPDDKLFVVARAQEGSRMPLAMLQGTVRDLPLHFTLDDSMGMSGSAKLSGVDTVVVSARISKNSNPAPEKGDLLGQSVPVSVGSQGLRIEINGVHR